MGRPSSTMPTKTVFNGSRLGKEFSANVFNDLFAGQDGIHPPQQSAGVERPAQQQGHTGASEWNGHDTEYQPDHKDNTAQNVADAFSLFAPVQGGASGDQPHRSSGKRRKGAGTAGSSNLPQYLQF